jgi:hypothetical protein
VCGGGVCVAELVGVLFAEPIHPACMCERGGRGGEGVGRVFNYTYIYSGKRESCEGAELTGVLVAEIIHPACMCEGGGRGGEAGGRAIGPENAVGEWARRRKGE